MYNETILNSYSFLNTFRNQSTTSTLWLHVKMMHVQNARQTLDLYTLRTIISLVVLLYPYLSLQKEMKCVTLMAGKRCCIPKNEALEQDWARFSSIHLWGSRLITGPLKCSSIHPIHEQMCCLRSQTMLHAASLSRALSSSRYHPTKPIVFNCNNWY